MGRHFYYSTDKNGEIRKVPFSKAKIPDGCQRKHNYKPARGNSTGFSEGDSELLEQVTRAYLARHSAPLGYTSGFQASSFHLQMDIADNNTAFSWVEPVAPKAFPGENTIQQSDSHSEAPPHSLCKSSISPLRPCGGRSDQEQRLLEYRAAMSSHHGHSRQSASIQNLNSPQSSSSADEIVFDPDTSSIPYALRSLPPGFNLSNAYLSPGSDKVTLESQLDQSNEPEGRVMAPHDPQQSGPSFDFENLIEDDMWE
jgi:hypothetical protein